MTDVETLENGNVRLPMACRCGDEHNREMLELRTRASDILELDDKQDLVTSILYALNAWYSPAWDLTRVGVDMWMGLTVTQWKDGKKVTVTCDTFEDGLARIFLYVYDNFERDE